MPQPKVARWKRIRRGSRSEMPSKERIIRVARRLGAHPEGTTGGTKAMQQARSYVWGVFKRNLRKRNISPQEEELHRRVFLGGEERPKIKEFAEQLINVVGSKQRAISVVNGIFADIQATTQEINNIRMEREKMKDKPTSLDIGHFYGNVAGGILGYYQLILRELQKA